MPTDNFDEDFKDRIRKLTQLIQKFLETLDTITVEAEDLDVDVAGIVQAFGLPPARAGNDNSTAMPDYATLLAMYRAEGKRGVHSLLAKRDDNGYLSVRIDRGKEFALTEKQGDLFAVLLRDCDFHNHPHTSWRPYAEIAIALGYEDLDKQARDKISTTVGRLRDNLLTNNVNRLYIETDQHKGVRLVVSKNINQPNLLIQKEVVIQEEEVV